MGLCSRCSAGVQGAHPQDEPIGEDRRPHIKVTLPRYRWKNVNACCICAKFSSWLEAESKHMALKAWRRGPLQVEFYLYAKIGLIEPQDGVLLPCSIAVVLPGQNKSDLPFSIDLNFVNSRDFNITVLEAPRTVGFDFNLIESWISGCRGHHEKCRVNDTQSWYPTRLLYLGSDDRDVKLIITTANVPHGPYVTLSHRWGDHNYKKLDSTTEAEFQHSINVTGLPQIFQDAIKISRSIGVDYIWIDALCIKQDSDLADWKIESQRMYKVYSYSYLNISATFSQDGSETLLRPRSWATANPSPVELVVDDVLQTFYLLDDDVWNDEIENGALNKRGWVFQERYLAPRVLHFGHGQMGWECKELRTLEMFPNGPPSVPGVDGMKMASSDCPNADEFRIEWKTLAQRYSKCNLTRPMDKLIALAGIASHIKTIRTSDTYSAGMWSSTMLYDLAWARHIEDVERFPVSSTGFRAPTWSWASVDGEVMFPEFFPGAQKFHFAEITSLHDDTLDRGDAIIACGSVQLKGLCLPLSLSWSDDQEIISFDILGIQFSTYEGLLGSKSEPPLTLHPPNAPPFPIQNPQNRVFIIN